MATPTQPQTIFSAYIKNYHQRLQTLKQIENKITACQVLMKGVGQAPITSQLASRILSANEELLIIQSELGEILAEKKEIETALEEQFEGVLKGITVKHVTDIYSDGSGNNQPQTKEIFFENQAQYSGQPKLNIYFADTNQSLIK
jgi:hypothetical protein